MEELGKRHRRAFRSMFALIGAFLLMACLTVFLSVVRGNTSANRATPSPVAAALRPARLAEPRTERTAPVDQPSPAPASEPATTTSLQQMPSIAKLVRPLPAVHVAKLQNAPAAPAAAPAAAPSAAPSATKPDLAPSFGFLTLDTSPWSTVSVGGRSLGQTPLIGVKLPSGSQVLSLKNPELGIETSYPVTIESGKTTVRRIGIE